MGIQGAKFLRGNYFFCRLYRHFQHNPLGLVDLTYDMGDIDSQQTKNNIPRSVSFHESKKKCNCPFGLKLLAG